LPTNSETVLTSTVRVSKCANLLRIFATGPTYLCITATNMAVMSDVTVESFFGATLARATDKAGMKHRHWFDTTDEGRIVCVAEVIDHTDDDRHYVPNSRITLPDAVEQAICEHHDVDEVYVINV